MGVWRVRWLGRRRYASHAYPGGLRLAALCGEPLWSSSVTATAKVQRCKTCVGMAADEGLNLDLDHTPGCMCRPCDKLRTAVRKLVGEACACNPAESLPCPPCRAKVAIMKGLV